MQKQKTQNMIALSLPYFCPMIKKPIARKWLMAMAMGHAPWPMGYGPRPWDMSVGLFAYSCACPGVMGQAHHKINWKNDSHVQQICMVNLWTRYAKKLCRNILLQFELITFQLAYGRTRKPSF